MHGRPRIGLRNIDSILLIPLLPNCHIVMIEFTAIARLHIVDIVMIARDAPVWQAAILRWTSNFCSLIGVVELAVTRPPGN
jgi:hypothetical protein